MDERDVVRDLVAKLIEAVEASLDGSTAVREALDELVRSGYEPRIILLADAAPRTGESGDDDDPGDDASEADHRSDAANRTRRARMTMPPTRTRRARISATS